jgi:hypothetical protein
MERPQIRNVPALFEAFGRTVDLAEAIGQPLWRVEKWRQRKRIPAEYWAPICEAFERESSVEAEVSVDLLMRIHSVPTPGRRASAG